MPTITITRRDDGDRWDAVTTVPSPRVEGARRPVTASGRTAARALENLLARPSVDREVTPAPAAELPPERGQITVQWGTFRPPVLQTHNLFHTHQARPSCILCRRYGTRAVVTE